MENDKDNGYEIVLINEEYFLEHSDFVEMLDPNNIKKQTDRCYVFICFKYIGNNVLVPFRTHIPNIEKIGRVAYKLPSSKRPNAGLDYRKVLIVNDDRYISHQECIRLPKSQTSVIKNNYVKIESEVIKYIEGYIKSAKKGREYKDKKYKYSTLHNFHDELRINGLEEVAITSIEKDR